MCKNKKDFFPHQACTHSAAIFTTESERSREFRAESSIPELGRRETGMETDLAAVSPWRAGYWSSWLSIPEEEPYRELEAQAGACTRFSSRTPSVSFPFFSTAPSLFLSIFPRKLRGNRQIFGSEPSLRLVWAQNQPNFRPNRQNAGNFAENPCIPGTYPATAWVFCRFPQFCLRFCPRPALRLSLSVSSVGVDVVCLPPRAPLRSVARYRIP